MIYIAFTKKYEAFRTYFEQNKRRETGQKKRFFYLLAGGRFLLQQGMYLSEIDEELLSLLIPKNMWQKALQSRPLASSVQTRNIMKERQVRVGQQEFSKKVRSNYNHHCCFPGCPTSDDLFLIGSHIARWCDAPALSGNIDNGLCLCLMHDKAFEAGLFTIDKDLCIKINEPKIEMVKNSWSKEHLYPFNGHSVHLGNVLPSREALTYHWKRNAYSFPSPIESSD